MPALSAIINMDKEIYIFLGPESGKKQAAIDEIREKKSKKEKPEETVLYAGETPAVQIADTILNHSLFSLSRFIIIKNAEQIKKKEDVSLILSCLENIDAQTSLLLISDEFKLTAGLDESCPSKNRKVFYEMFEREKSEWVRNFFSVKGYRINADAIAAILEMVANNTDSLGRECTRLMLFLSNDHPINEEDVTQWLSHSREESAFTLFSRIAAGDSIKAFESLHSLLAAKESPPGILAGLSWCFRKLRDYLALTEKGEPNSFEMKKIGLSSPKARDDYFAAARRYDSKAVDACLALSAEYDIITRSLGAPLEVVLMDAYLVKIFNASTL